MAVTILVESSSTDALGIGLSPLAELGAVLHGVAGPDHHPLPGLFTRFQEKLSPATHHELSRLSPLWSGYRARFLYPDEAGPGRRFEDELAAVTRLPIHSFLESTAWVVRGGYTGAPDGMALAHDTAAQEDVIARSRRRGPETEALARRAFDDPEALRSHVVATLAEVFDQFFAAEWERIVPTLTHDAGKRIELAQRSGPISALASLTPASQLLMDPLRLRIDKLRHAIIKLGVTPTWLVPSLAGWPHLTVKHEPGWPPVVHYPIRDLSRHQEQDLALPVVLTSLRALTDPTRLNLCRLVAREAASTSDLAARTGMSIPQVSRHLRHLREAGLVHTYRDGRVVLYRLNLDGVRNIGTDLLRALLR